MNQSIAGTNVQTVTLNSGSIVNIAREGEASINIASNLGPIKIRDSRFEVFIEGSIINSAEGRNRTSRVNIGVNEAAKP